MSCHLIQNIYETSLGNVASFMTFGTRLMKVYFLYVYTCTLKYSNPCYFK